MNQSNRPRNKEPFTNWQGITMLLGLLAWFALMVWVLKS